MCFRPGELDIPKICPDCKTMNDKSATVCKNCGAELPESNEQAMPTPAPPGAPSAPGTPSTPPPPAPPGQSSN